MTNVVDIICNMRSMGFWIQWQMNRAMGKCWKVMVAIMSTFNHSYYFRSTFASKIKSEVHKNNQHSNNHKL